MQDICQGELTSEGIPKAVVGQHITLVDFSIVGTIIIRCAVRPDFIELAREQVCPKQTTIEGSQLLFASSFHSDAVQQSIPRLEAPLLCLFQSFIRAQFRAPVLPGLFLGDVA